MNSTSFCLLLLALLSGCGSSRPYNRPDLEVPVTFRGQSQQIGSDSTGPISWKSFFQDPILQNLIDGVLQRNYDLSSAIGSIRINEEYLKQARASRMPVISANIGTSNNNFSDNSLNGANGFDLSKTMGIAHLEDYTVNIGVSWEADIWGKIKNQKAEAKANWLKSQRAKQLLQTRLISLTASGYYNILMLREQLAIAKNNLILSDSTVRIIRTQLENGAATSLALQQAQVQRKATLSIIPDLQKDLFVQENALGLLMGNQPSVVSIPEDRAHSFELPRQFSVGVPMSLLRYRPDIKEKELELMAANARIGIAKANLYPALSISANGGLGSFQAGNWLSFPSSLFTNMAVNLTQPLLSRRRLRTTFNVSKIVYQQKANEFKNGLLFATAEVSDNLQSAERTTEKIAIAESNTELLDKAISDARLLFSNGMANYLEVITVQQNLLQNQLNLAFLKKQKATTYIDLFRAIGGGADK